MVIGLGVVVSCGEYEQVRNKCYHIIRALPRPWVISQKEPAYNNSTVHSVVYKIGLHRFAKFLVSTFGSTSNTAVPTKCIEDGITFLRMIGAQEESNTIERNLAERVR